MQRGKKGLGDRGLVSVANGGARRRIHAQREVASQGPCEPEARFDGRSGFACFDLDDVARIDTRSAPEGRSSHSCIFAESAHVCTKPGESLADEPLNGLVERPVSHEAMERSWPYPRLIEALPSRPSR